MEAVRLRHEVRTRFQLSCCPDVAPTPLTRRRLHQNCWKLAQMTPGSKRCDTASPQNSASDEQILLGKKKRERLDLLSGANWSVKRGAADTLCGEPPLP